MSLLTAVLLGLLIWLLVLLAITLVFVRGARLRRRGSNATPEPERRRGRDRRVGRPDPRPVRVERRRGQDRRGLTA